MRGAGLEGPLPCHLRRAGPAAGRAGLQSAGAVLWCSEPLSAAQSFGPGLSPVCWLEFSLLLAVSSHLYGFALNKSLPSGQGEFTRHFSKEVSSGVISQSSANVIYRKGNWLPETLILHRCIIPCNSEEGDLGNQGEELMRNWKSFLKRASVSSVK